MQRGYASIVASLHIVASLQSTAKVNIIIGLCDKMAPAPTKGTWITPEADKAMQKQKRAIDLIWRREPASHPAF
jgi:hypothetical protein